MKQSADFSKIKAIVLDIDGVLTDGKIGYRNDHNEIKFFHVRDGHGIVLARRAGLKVGILSGRRSLANEVRAQELKLDFLYQGSLNKADGFALLLKEQGLSGEEVMYIGDDLVDIPPMRQAGIAVAVGDGVAELDHACHLRTKNNGGCGAVREAIEYLLKGQGKWDELLERYLG